MMAVLEAHPTFADGPSPFHNGQQEVQTRVGVRENSESVGRRVIRKHMNAQAKAFFEELPYLFVSVKNDDGSVWATAFCGQPGFIKAVDDHHLQFATKTFYGDAAQFSLGAPMGSVGVMLHNRRRNKINGVVESVSPGLLTMRVIQSMGNCPKYIQVRHIKLDDKLLATLGDEERPVTQGGAQLGEEELALIARSDTAFLATCFAGPGNGAEAVEVCTCNHRGGSPGFVQATGKGTLTLPDYVGNSMYQSLGNILAQPEAGLQFIDFTNGDSLQLTGTAQILFDDHSLPGALRAIRFVTQRWVHVKGALPISALGAVEPSPYNPILRPGEAGAGLVKCVGRQQETHDITTFEFAAPPRADGKAFCEAGQFASFDFPQISPDTTLNRTWTISSTPDYTEKTGRFTITVKKAGLVSSWLHENLTPGGEVLFRGVDGEFTLSRAAKCIPPEGVLLVAGGIGVTPMKVMFAECIEKGYPVTFLYTFRTMKDAALLGDFQEGARRSENVKLGIALTGGASGDSPPEGIQIFQGRVNPGMIKQLCPDVLDREAFQCGPEPMMNTVTSVLDSLGMPLTKLHQESFSF